MNTTMQRPSLYEHAMTIGLRELYQKFMRLNWSQPLTREDIQAQWPTLPHHVYLRLPAMRQFVSPVSLMHTLWAIEFGKMSGGVPADMPDERLVLLHGGPPAWGPDPLLAGEVQESGSATDTDKLAVSA
jgi:hypothetical protein